MERTNRPSSYRTTLTCATLPPLREHLARRRDTLRCRPHQHHMFLDAAGAARDAYREGMLRELVDVRQKLGRLSGCSPLRRALPEKVLHRVVTETRHVAPSDLRFRKWPCIIGFLGLASHDVIRELEADLETVIRHSAPANRAKVTQFLNARAEEDRRWYAGIFEVWAKATVLKQGLRAQFDYVLPNGRDCDMRVTIGDRDFYVECTVITQDDEGREVGDRFLEAKRRDPNLRILRRPGPFCPPNARGPSPYYMTRRFYAKVYDKIAKDLDPDKSQCAVDAPNILLMSFSGPGVWADNSGVVWALEELFADQPRSTRAKPTGASGIPDLTLKAWLEFTAQERIQKGSLSRDDYIRNWSDLISAPRRLGGIILFDNCAFSRSRVNYNVDPACAVSHAEIAELERLFGNGPSHSL